MKTISLLLCTILFLGCKPTDKEVTEKEPSFLISGTITGNYNDYIFLNYNNKKDSTLVVDGEFSFRGTVDRPYAGYLLLNRDPLGANPVSLYVENSDIIIDGEHGNLINGKPGNFLKLNSVSGSHSRKIKEDYQTFYQENQNKENFKKLLSAKLDTFVVENGNHPFTGAVIAELAYVYSILSKKELENYFSQIDTTRISPDDITMFKMGIQNLDNYSKGKSFVQSTLSDGEGIQKPILEKGKVTLVDFWASWCMPCRAKHPDLIILNKKLENQDFEIVSISIDSDKSAWLRAITKDGLTWKNLHDENKYVYHELGLEAVPQSYLVDRDGIVIGQNLSIESIEKEVASRSSN